MQPENQPGDLAERLRRMRTAAGLTGDQLAERLGWPAGTGQGKVSKIENRRQAASEDDIKGWARVTGNAGLTDELLDLRSKEHTVQIVWRKGLRSSGATSVQQQRDERTQAATRVRDFDPVLIPGLLQTPEYARGLFERATLLFGQVDVDGAVRARMQRQQVLYTDKTFEFVITEAALHLLPCSRDAMLGQYDRLLTLYLPNVTLGIIPFGRELALPPYNTFNLLDDNLTVETLAGKTEEPGGEASATYQRAFDLLMAEALTGDDARRLIISAAERLRGSV